MNSTASLGPENALPLESEVRRLRALQTEGRHGEALAQTRQEMSKFPESRELALIEASALRHMGRIEDALASLDRLAVLHPHFSLMHQERGLCHVARKDAAASVSALRAALSINPALPVAWKILNGIYRMTGDEAKAAQAAQQAAALGALPPEVIQATSLFSDGEIAAAEAIVRRFLVVHGDHPEAMRLLAKIGVAREVYDDAELLLSGVLTLVPDHRAARYEYAHVLMLRYKPAEAQAALAPLLAEDPRNSQYRTLSSTIAVGLGHQEEAIELYRGLLADLPVGEAFAALPPEERIGVAATHAEVNMWLGHALKTVGSLDLAIVAYREAVRVRPSFGDAWWSLANLKTYRFDADEIVAMTHAEADPSIAPIDRVHLAFALGKAHEDLGDVDTAWAAYSRGNAARRVESRYRPEIFETNTAEQKRVCTAGFFAARANWGCTAPDPFFIVGLPRSGSTLIEQILASHPLVEGTQELPQIQRITLDLQGRDPDLDHPRYPGALADLTSDQVRALGERYLAETRIHRQTDSPFFIDKMPNNFRHLGLIQLILPNARIIDARRDPMSCCFSNFKQLFAQGQEFTYSLDDIARYYRTYLELMEHWDRVLPGRVLRVQHEDVVDDLEASVHRILAHCGLPFEQDCVDFHQTRRSVRTPSSEQVRRPIFRDGLDQWSRYNEWLQPLRERLGDAMTRYRG